MFMNQKPGPRSVELCPVDASYLCVMCACDRMFVYRTQRIRGDSLHRGKIHIELVGDSDPVPGLEELLSKIAKDEQV